MLAYPATIDLSVSALRLVTRVIRRYRAVIGSRWRRLSCGRQALLVLAHLRCGDTLTRLAAGFGVGVATAWRYVTETTRLLASAAPTLRQATAGRRVVIVDGTLIRTDAVASRAFISGKHRCYGVNLQIVSAPDGRLLWISPGLPGSVPDITAARRHHILDRLSQAGITVLADKGYTGAGGTTLVPYRRRRNQQQLTSEQRTHNRTLGKLRARGERANATLKHWRILRHVRSCPRQAHLLAHAILTLEHHTQPR